jgi:hypothetical protein
MCGIYKKQSWFSPEYAMEIVLAHARQHFETLDAWPTTAQFALGDRVYKKSGSQWSGTICGFYSTEQTAIGYAVESDAHKGSVQIWPEAALQLHTIADLNSTKLQSKICAEIKHKKKTYEDYKQNDTDYQQNGARQYVSALEWVLSILESEA